MPSSLTSLLEQVKPDSWRKDVGFSADIAEANEKLFRYAGDVPKAKEILSDWLQRYQPCLFGRIAAKSGLIEHCILSESDLESTAGLRSKIQDARRSWLRQTFAGSKSSFVISLISPRIANGVPDETVLTLAKTIASLYLLNEVEPDTVYVEDVFLEKPGYPQVTWTWKAGVNYFCTQGDKRWWHDHRIPGGLGLSVNSVGHMAKSGMLARSLRSLNEVLGVSEIESVNPKIVSLGKALEVAMRTIGLAADTCSGRATELLPKSDVASEGQCPIELPAFLRTKDHRQYQGYYNTDHTLPRVYFKSDSHRDPAIPRQLLDFTYLFEDDDENFDHELMGTGRPIRADATDGKNLEGRKFSAESNRQQGRAKLIRIDEAPLLKDALDEGAFGERDLG